MPWHGDFLRVGEAWKLASLGVSAGLAYWLAARTFLRLELPARRGVWVSWSVAIVLRLAILPVLAGDDVWRYRWEGIIQLHGFNPYRLNPDAPELAALRDADWTRINHRGYPAIYTPLTQAVFVALTGASCDILVHALTYCQTHKGLQIYAWVILDNHFHAIVAGPELSRTVAAVKRRAAQRILTRVETEGREWLLNQLQCHRARHKAESQHQIWQEGFHPQELSTDESMLQKPDYIHHNPVERGLVSLPAHWRYSSAHEWLAGSKPVLRCDWWR